MNGKKVNNVLKSSIIVHTLKAGTAFGDIALRYRLPRTSSARCSNISDLAVLTRKSYNDIMLLYYTYKFKKEMNLFS